MNANNIESKFAAMGARIKVRKIASRWRQGDRTWVSPADFAVDIRRDGNGEFFELRVPTHLSETLDVSVIQAEPKQRHLLLFIRKQGEKPQLDRFLCGHDEREWFVAAVPGGASSVRQAMDALQPKDVREALTRNHVSSRKRYARKNRAFRRQGEWFFVPEPSFAVNEKLILRNEPLRRGSGKPHLVEEIFRSGGEMVHVCDRYPNGIPPDEYRAIIQRNPNASRGTGAAVCDHYSKIAFNQFPDLPSELKRLAWLSLDSQEGQEYWNAMELMGQYAAANHACIHRHIAEHLGAQVLLDLENHHNFAWKEKHIIDGVEREVIVHRKGATPAGAGVLGIIPGSMATPGFVVSGKGNPESLNSASHGAGRTMSRKSANEKFNWKDVNRFLKQQGVTLISAGLDEVPMAYKNIREVMAAQQDLVTVLGQFDPKLVKMAPSGERPED